MWKLYSAFWYSGYMVWECAMIPHVDQFLWMQPRQQWYSLHLRMGSSWHVPGATGTRYQHHHGGHWRRNAVLFFTNISLRITNNIWISLLHYTTVRAIVVNISANCHLQWAKHKLLTNYLARIMQRTDGMLTARMILLRPMKMKLWQLIGTIETTTRNVRSLLTPFFKTRTNYYNEFKMWRKY